MPYCCESNYDEYMNYLSKISPLCDKIDDSPNVYITYVPLTDVCRTGVSVNEIPRRNTTPPLHTISANNGSNPGNGHL